MRLTHMHTVQQALNHVHKYLSDGSFMLCCCCCCCSCCCPTCMPGHYGVLRMYVCVLTAD